MADSATIMARLDTLQAAVQTMANADGSWPCSFDHPGGPDDEPVSGAGKKPEPKSAV